MEGVGVLLSRMGGGADEDGAFAASIGKTIKAVAIDDPHVADLLRVESSEESAMNEAKTFQIVRAGSPKPRTLSDAVVGLCLECACIVRWAKDETCCVTKVVGADKTTIQYAYGARVIACPTQRCQGSIQLYPEGSPIASAFMEEADLCSGFAEMAAASIEKRKAARSDAFADVPKESTGPRPLAELLSSEGPLTGEEFGLVCASSR